jgi:hypothetical protein
MFCDSIRTTTKNSLMVNNLFEQTTSKKKIQKARKTGEKALANISHQTKAN